MTDYTAFEITAEQAYFLADHLQAGTLPWKLAITVPYGDLSDRAGFNERCTAELTELKIIDEQGQVHAGVADAIRTVCGARQWLEWFVIKADDPEQMARAVAARISPPNVVVAQRYAQMITFTQMHLSYSESLVPVVTALLPEQPPARFTEFTLPMDLGVAIDSRIAQGADIVETLTAFDIPDREAQVMELARSGERTYIELTAHEATNGARHATDVSVNVTSSEVGRILVSTPPGEPREGGNSVFAPAENFAVAMAIRELTARLPSGTWFPDENFDI